MSFDLPSRIEHCHFRPCLPDVVELKAASQKRSLKRKKVSRVFIFFGGNKGNRGNNIVFINYFLLPMNIYEG